MLIGIDLDNTIICYEKALSYAFLKQEFLSLKDKNINFSKKNIKHFLIENFGENKWTELQGYIYGSYIQYAEIFNGFKKFLKKCNNEKIDIIIISHKTVYPVLGPKINLRKAALNFLNQNLINEGLYYSNIYFENTINDKIKRINKFKFNYFIDDLIKIFENKNFSKTINPILFDPNTEINNSDYKKINILNNWNDILKYLFN